MRAVAAEQLILPGAYGGLCLVGYRVLGSRSAPLPKYSTLISLTESFQLLVKHGFFGVVFFFPPLLLHLSETKIEKVLYCHGTASASFQALAWSLQRVRAGQ